MFREFAKYLLWGLREGSYPMTKTAVKWSRQFLVCSLQIHHHSSRYTNENFTFNICSNRQQKVSQLKVGKVSHFRIVLLDRFLTIFRDFLKFTLGSIIWLWRQKHYSNVLYLRWWDSGEAVSSCESTREVIRILWIVPRSHRWPCGT